MSSAAPPLVPESRGGLGDRFLPWSLSAAVRASLLFSPRPAALLVRKVFASDGAPLAAALEKHAPAGVEALLDERYCDESDMLLDVFRPASASGETLFVPDDEQPPLGHEYQSDLDSDAGALFLERMRTFLRQRLAAPSRP
ncbi:MAG: hypothetical protein ACRDNP_07595 [Gaiellaceae bacterium]